MHRGIFPQLWDFTPTTTITPLCEHTLDFAKSNLLRSMASYIETLCEEYNAIPKWQVAARYRHRLTLEATIDFATHITVNE